MNSPEKPSIEPELEMLSENADLLPRVRLAERLHDLRTGAAEETASLELLSTSPDELACGECQEVVLAVNTYSVSRGMD